MIDKGLLESVLSLQRKKTENRAGERLFPRMAEPEIDTESPQAQLITGVRGCGKTTLCLKILRERGVRFAYADFSDERLTGLRSDQLNDVLEVLYMINGDFSCLFLDEIERVEGWELFANRLLRKRMHVIAAGSGAGLLSGRFATHLTGRNKVTELFPLSFREFCMANDVDTESRTAKAEAFRRAPFDRYLMQGGFPEVRSAEESRRYAAGLVSDSLRDAEERSRISCRKAFESMTEHLLCSVPCVAVPKDFAGKFGFRSDHTARKYIDCLKSAYLLTGIQKYSPECRIRLTQEKLYAADAALMPEGEKALSAAGQDRRLGTAVLAHLIRRCRAEGLDVRYLSGWSGGCDFVVCNGNKVREAIQVSSDISDRAARRQKIRGLLLAQRMTGCSDLLLLTHHSRDDTEVSGCRIRIRPVYEWCLEPGI
ncbi:MAG: ATP-binding protein [Pseudomonadota bacterium]|nr:ATP-binding protein [Pseudomonadota bacterium]